MRIKTFGKTDSGKNRYISYHAKAKHFGFIEDKVDRDSLEWETISLFSKEVSFSIVNDIVKKISEKLEEKSFYRRGQKMIACISFQLKKNSNPVKLGAKYEVNCGDVVEDRTTGCFFGQTIFEWFPEQGLVENVTVYPVDEIDERNQLLTFILKN